MFNIPPFESFYVKSNRAGSLFSVSTTVGSVGSKIISMKLAPELQYELQLRIIHNVTTWLVDSPQL